jgi:hypothetical protein
MRRTVLHFSLRMKAEVPLAEAAGQAGKALGCTLAPGSFNGTSVMRAELLGMVIVLSVWPSENRIPTFQLHGIAENAAVEDTDFVDISQAVIDLLAERGVGQWHVPTTAEIEMEAKVADEIDREHD